MLIIFWKLLGKRHPAFRFMPDRISFRHANGEDDDETGAEVRWCSHFCCVPVCCWCRRRNNDRLRYASRSPLAGFTSYTEHGFTLDATAGTWTQALLFGNPAPDISTTGSTGDVTVTEGGLSFTFTSFDLASAARGPSLTTYVITGSLGGTDLFTQTGDVGGNGPLPPFATVISQYADVQIDSLVISLTSQLPSATSTTSS